MPLSYLHLRLPSFKALRGCVLVLLNLFRSIRFWADTNYMRLNDCSHAGEDNSPDTRL